MTSALLITDGAKVKAGSAVPFKITFTLGSLPPGIKTFIGIWEMKIKVSKKSGTDWKAVSGYFGNASYLGLHEVLRVGDTIVKQATFPLRSLYSGAAPLGPGAYRLESMFVIKFGLAKDDIPASYFNKGLTIQNDVKTIVIE